ncbi:1501_t:CDS:1, partial [Racocetra persica]
DPNGIGYGTLGNTKIKHTYENFIAKHMPKHNQEAIRKNSKRILLAKFQNVENSSDISCDSDFDSNCDDNGELYLQDNNESIENVNLYLI